MTTQLSHKGAATGRVIFEILRLSGRLAAAGDALVGDIGLTSARWQVLATADFAKRSPTVSDIARRLGLARQSVQRLVNELAADGFVRLEDNPAHKRAKLVVVTESGKDILQQAEARRAPWTEGLADPLRHLDIAAAESVLAGLRQALDKSA
ncbi:MarR family winged helix-turn-helix transcriptional regulator [Pseudoruegeria sp. HB172150]|uniref:MarR family winged helix-turn-helix transcriptional regulator n=1 Tax=Pseudoruegeria sp. HB172150 TaxID=2721164 RepID=UPI0015543086|nr:MarR family transcriptional regulator [Pseudoruegeria sp. HB172150]